MNKNTKIAILVVIVGATIAGLIFYANKTKAPIQEAPKAVSTPAATNNQPQAQTQPTNQLPPLPADNKQAITSEVKDIDGLINSVDKTLDSDTQDGALGL